MNIKLATSGDYSLFIINNMNLDNVYYYEVHDNFFIFVSDMKYNSNPETEVQNRPWRKDLHQVGLMLSKILVRNCDFVME